LNFVALGSLQANIIDLLLLGLPPPRWLGEGETVEPFKKIVKEPQFGFREVLVLTSPEW
jgi:hypothetical protein